MADRGKEGTTMYQKNGLLYWILDDRGKKIGVPIKASALVSRPTMKNLQNQFRAYEQLRLMYKERLTKVIDAFSHAADRHNRANFFHYLNSYGINPVFRENKDGRVYGITFIDNRKGAVINGGDLGKGYSGQALAKRFNDSVDAGEKGRRGRVEQANECLQREGNERSVANWVQDTSQPLLDLMKAENPLAELANPMFKKRRKKRRGLSL